MSAEKKNIFKKVKDYVLKQDGLYPVSRDTSSDTVFMGNSNASDVNTLTTVVGDGNYTSYDAGEATDALYSDSVIPKIVNNESFTNVMPKLTRIVNNVRYLVHALGSTDISAIGDGTVTGALSTLNSNCKRIPFIQSGKTGSVGNGSWSTYQVTFEKKFTAIPLVSITNVTSFSNENVYVSSITKTGAVINVYTPSTSFDYEVRWQAIGY